MEFNFIKDIADAGLGLGALIALIVVIVKQMEMLKSMQATIDINTQVTASLKESVDATTEATHKMIDLLKAKNINI